MNKLVSVVVPIFNIESYIGTCIDSICMQTYKNIEILLVDDGSTDNSGNICDTYADLDYRIKVIHKENGGLVSARKAGYEAASGEYCINVDGDDWIDEHMIERMYSVIERTDSDFAQCGYVEESDRKICHQFAEYEIEIDKSKSVEEMLTSWMRGENIIGNQIFTKIFKLSFLKECYMNVSNEMCLGEDMIFLLLCLKNVRKIASISDVMYHYRIRKASLSHAEGSDFILKEDNLTREIHSMCLELFSKDIKLELDKWVIARKLSIIRNKMKIYVPIYQFQDPKVLFSNRIIVYGAGIAGYDCIRQLSLYEKIEIQAWVDKMYEVYDYPIRRVEEISHINNYEYDYIIIAVVKKEMAEEIMTELQRKYNVPNKKMLWSIESVKY